MRTTVTRWLALGLLAAIASTGCESKAPASSLPSSAASAAPGPLKLGAAIGETQRVPLASIAKDTAKYANTAVTTEGRVTSVCQAMGCWMEIADPAGEAHVRMSGHSFFIPKNAAGRRAVVRGTVLPKPDNGECEQEALQATGKPVQIELDATGVELL